MQDHTAFDLINEELYRSSPFSVPCPHCRSAATYPEDTAKTYPTHASCAAFDAGSDADVYSGTIFGECGCTNHKCQESTHFLGSFRTECDDLSIPPSYPPKFVIKYFFPPVPLIRIPPATPQKVASLLKRSFAPAFMDQSASGNLLRSAIEKLLTAQKVPRFVVSNCKRKRRNLHDRITLLPQTLQRYRDELLAIKWIGNAASHDELTVKSLKLCFEIVEGLLEELYGTKRREMARSIKRINQRKKP